MFYRASGSRKTYRSIGMANLPSSGYVTFGCITSKKPKPPAPAKAKQPPAKGDTKV